MATALAPVLLSLLVLGADGGTPVVVGTLSKDEVAKVMKRHNNEVRHCYEQSSRAKPQLAGKVAVKIVIGAKGDVLQAEIASDTTNDEALKDCMLKVVQSWTFPEPKGGGNVSVTYPWTFAP